MSVVAVLAVTMNAFKIVPVDKETLAERCRWLVNTSELAIRKLVFARISSRCDRVDEKLVVRACARTGSGFKTPNRIALKLSHNRVCGGCEIAGTLLYSCTICSISTSVARKSL